MPTFKPETLDAIIADMPAGHTATSIAPILRVELSNRMKTLREESRLSLHNPTDGRLRTYLATPRVWGGGRVRATGETVEIQGLSSVQDVATAFLAQHWAPRPVTRNIDLSRSEAGVRSAISINGEGRFAEFIDDKESFVEIIVRPK